MITLSRLNGAVVAINPDLITWIDVTPDTVVSLLGGDKIIVREPLEEVVSRVVAFRRSVLGIDPTSSAYPPSEQVLHAVASRRDSSNPSRPTNRPSARPSSPHGGSLSSPPIVFKR